MRGGMVEEIISWLGWVSIVLWAGLEVWWGVNYFRRLLGLMVLFMVIFSRFWLLITSQTPNTDKLCYISSEYEQ